MTTREKSNLSKQCDGMNQPQLWTAIRSENNEGRYWSSNSLRTRVEEPVDVVSAASSATEARLLHLLDLLHPQPVAEPGLSRTPGRVLSIDVHKLTVQKIHENINGKIDNIQKATSRSNIFILLQQLIQVQR